MRILIVEDERRLAQTLADLMEAHNYGADIAYDGEEGLDNALSGIYDVILLDVMLPKRSGYEIVHALRKEGDKTPVLMLTARTEVEDRINGLDSGADYYLTKPFGVMELVSCVKAVLRRCARPSHVLHLSGLSLDQDARTVSCDGQRVPLTYKEYELLRLLLSHPGMAFTRDQLMAQVWGTDYCGETRTVDMHIRTLRQKLGPYGSLIQTVRNVGYRLEEQE